MLLFLVPISGLRVVSYPNVLKHRGTRLNISEGLHRGLPVNSQDHWHKNHCGELVKMHVSSPKILNLQIWSGTQESAFLITFRMEVDHSLRNIVGEASVWL